MQQRKLLIVGIDPGTTTGYAILDISGNLVAVDSSKNLGLSWLISEVAKFGRVVIAGTDKGKVPDLVHRFAAKLGAKTINPKEDLSIAEKREMSKMFSVKNCHENDALASAFFAFNEVRHLIRKIDKIDFGDRESVKELVISKGMSIKHAVDYLAPKEEIGTAKTESPEQPQINIERVLNKMRNYEKEVYFLRKYILRLKNEKSKTIIERRSIDYGKKISSLLKFKEERIRSYASLLMEKDSRISSLKQDIMNLSSIVLDSKSYYILKKIRNLGYLELENKKMTLKIGKEDILLVEDANIASRRTIEEIKGKINVIVYQKPLSRKAEDELHFTLISADKLPIYDLGSFAVVRKEFLDREIDKKSVFRKIIIDYKKEKESILMSHS